MDIGWLCGLFTKHCLLSCVGPDPPTVSLDPVVVARYEETVQTLCSIQPDAHEMGENPITWTDTEVPT